MYGGSRDETTGSGELLGEAHASRTSVSSHPDTSKAHPVLVWSQERWPATLGPRTSSLCRGLQPVLRSPSPELEGPPETAGLRLQ